MKVKDPIYSAEKINNSGESEYWLVTVNLREPEYRYCFYTFHISTDGVKVTMMTG
jgi:hypothetical protein